MTGKKTAPFKTQREFPSIEIVSQHERIKPYAGQIAQPLIVGIIRQVVEESKKRFETGARDISLNSLLEHIETDLEQLTRQALIPVINGTGIIIHTNLGRAPLATAMIDNIRALVGGYSNLEFDVSAGRRGRRGLYVGRLLAALCGTESGTLVNNNAAALFIILNTMANRKEVIISRGELVQIGGGFRIPDIMIKAGAKLIEVGTTNRTSLEDYKRAITDRTRMILKVHLSNFTQSGFVEQTSLSDLAGLCRQHQLLLTHDLGSGLVTLPPDLKLPGEPRIGDSVRGGADLVCFSGDKLLGSVQAGLIAGRQELVDKIKKNPLFRTIRCDKLVFSLMARTLTSYLNGTQYEDIPIWRMVAVPPSALKRRGEAILESVGKKGIVLRTTDAYLGGGSAPDQAIPSLGLSIKTDQPVNKLAARFRQFTPPIVGRIENDEFIIDLRTVSEPDDRILTAAISQIVE